MTKGVMRPRPTDIWGLKFFPSLEPAHSDDSETPYAGSAPAPEVSDCNIDVVKSVLTDLGTKVKAIMEIGVNRNGERSMSQVLINDRPAGSFYLGVDLEDKSYLDDPAANTWTIMCNSHDQEKVRGFLAEKKISELDILFIDGWHSVNTTINDWRYADLLSDNGVVIVHDTNFHPGDIALCEAVDENIFELTRLCFGNDNGISVIKRRPNTPKPSVTSTKTTSSSTVTPNTPVEIKPVAVEPAGPKPDFKLFG